MKYDTAALILIVVIGILIGLVVLGTFIDFICRMFSRRAEDLNTNKETISTQTNAIDFVLTFSLFKTVPELFFTRQSPSVIKAVGLLKLISMFFVIAFHVYINTLAYNFPLSRKSEHSTVLE